MRRIPAAICIAVVAATSAPGLASVWVGMVSQSASGGVTINLFTWYGFPMTTQFASLHEAEALDVVRRELVRAQKIRDLPILIWGPSRVENEKKYRVAIESDCEANYSAETGPPENRPWALPLGECYESIIPASSIAFEDALALVTALSDLSARSRSLEVADLPRLRSTRSAMLKPHGDLVLHFDPIWSPDGARLLYTVWSNGTTGVELLEPSSGVVRRLEPLEGYIAARPIWSDDSHSIAYASLDMVKVYDTRTRTTRTFRPAQPSSRARTLIQFDGARLRFAFDVGFFGGYETYVYDGSRGTLEQLASAPPHPFGEEALDLDRHVSLRAVRSPNREWIAVLYFVDGQRRIRVSGLR